MDQLKRKRDEEANERPEPRPTTTALDDIRSDPDKSRPLLMLILATTIEIYRNYKGKPRKSPAIAKLKELTDSPPSEINKLSSYDLFKITERFFHDKELIKIISGAHNIEHDESTSRRRRRSTQPAQPSNTPEWVDRLVQTTCGGCELTYITSKQLTETDMKNDQHRILLPKLSIQTNLGCLLREDERERMMCRGSNGGLDVEAYDGSLATTHAMMLRHWNMGTNGYCALNGSGWSSFKSACRLVDSEDVDVHVWSFRAGDEEDPMARRLFLAIDVVRRRRSESEGDGDAVAEEPEEGQ